MYNYRQMIDKAREKGITSEAAMYAGIDDVDMMLAKLKETNPQMYWDFLRKQHKNLYKGHYDEDYARYDLSEIYSPLRMVIRLKALIGQLKKWIMPQNQ